jgi:hypothetical protein
MVWKYHFNWPVSTSTAIEGRLSMLGYQSTRPPAFAQKAEIEAVNAKWIEFFNDFAGIASLYTSDAAAFPPGSCGAEMLSVPCMAEKVTDPRLTTLDVKLLAAAAAREIGTSKGADASRGDRDVRRGVEESITR